MRFKEKKKAEDNKRRAYDYLTQEKGLEPHIAVGIIGNFMQESGQSLDVEAYNPDDLGKPTFGLAQWRGDRLTKLKKVAGERASTLEGQLDFMMWEFDNTEKRAFKKLQQAENAEEAALAFSTYYERPHKDYAHNEKRTKYANNLYNTYVGETEEEYEYSYPIQELITDEEREAWNSHTPPREEEMPNYNIESYAQPVQVPYLENYSETETTEGESEQSTTLVDEAISKIEDRRNQISQFQQMMKMSQVQYIDPNQTGEQPQNIQNSGYQKAQKGVEVVRDNIPSNTRQQHLLKAQTEEEKAAANDLLELQETGTIERPRSIRYKKKVKEQPTIKPQDNRTTAQRKEDTETMESSLTGERPLIYLDNPTKILGDVGNALGIDNDLPNSEEDRLRINRSRLKGEGVEERFSPYLAGATVNTALGAGFAGRATVRGVLNETINPLAGIGRGRTRQLSEAKIDNKPPVEFKSEIDWNKWNSEIPTNKKLIEEYNTIEQTSKSNGTWMKNPDGSKFEGTPEQFIQIQSKNFKNAFPEGHLTTYKGSHIRNTQEPELGSKPHSIYGSNVFSNPDGNMLPYYSYGDKTKEELLKDYLYTNNNLNNNPLKRKGIYELAAPKHNNNIVIDAKNARWNNINDKKTFDILPNNIKKGNFDNEFTTDDIAQYINESSDLKSAIIKNVDDGAIGDVHINKQAPGNYLKSLRGNNGMFDMLNPNIYKTIVGGTMLSGASQLQAGGNTPSYNKLHELYLARDRGEGIHNMPNTFNPEKKWDEEIIDMMNNLASNKEKTNNRTVTAKRGRKIKK